MIVLTDDQRAETVNPEGMPRLWSDIREQGRNYPNASVPTSLCCPSRASILTGLYAHSHRVYSNAMPFGGYTLFHQRGLEDHTIALALHDAGYETSLVGKYLNGPFPEALAAGVVPVGWDHLISYTSRGDHYYNYTLNDGTTHGADPADYNTDVLAGYAKNFIRTAPDDKPLFLMLATTGSAQALHRRPSRRGAVARPTSSVQRRWRSTRTSRTSRGGSVARRRSTRSASTTTWPVGRRP